jgi:hypothetical protein
MRNKWCLALIMWFVLAPSALSQSVRSLNKVPGRIESTAQRLTHKLQKQGYEVARGYFRVYRKQDCDYSYAIMKTCYANNPAAPYIMPVLPTWPDEWLDPNLYGVFGPTEKDYSTTFRFDPREAIVILAQMPPPAKYFGLQTNVFTRQGAFKLDSDHYIDINRDYSTLLSMFFADDPIDTTRVQLLASLGNSINNVVIENKSSAAFDQQRYFVITPDQTMEEVVRGAFTDVGVGDHDVFTEPISTLLQVGLERAADDFVTLIRYAMPDDEKQRHPASETWQQDLPLVVLRVRDHRTDRPPVPYSPVQLDPMSKTDPPETALGDDLNSLVYAVCQRWGVSCVLPSPPPAFAGTRVFSMVKVQTAPVRMIGPECMPDGMNCLADTLDAAYNFGPKLPFSGQRVYAVVGALSTETGNATYVGLGINASKRQQGIDNVSGGELLGSADDYRSAVTNYDKFFVFYLARDCTKLEPWASQHCRSILEADLPDYNPTDDNPDRLMVSLRDYIFPGSKRGPQAESVLAPYVIAVKTP